MVEIKTDADVDTMREAGRVVAGALAAVQSAAAEGIRLRELDEAARAVLTAAGARSPFLGYQPSFAPVPFPP
jgi:methionyl aminopeptidase